MSAESSEGSEEFFQALHYNADGLIPAIAQCAQSGTVLMMAWMNRESLQVTLDSGQVVYWSRSRGKLWRKGETSGNAQKLVEMRLDCDGDTLLLRVDQQGAACHTGRRDCFYRVADATARTWHIDQEPLQDPAQLYGGDSA